jgi:hypothetical protein
LTALLLAPSEYADEPADGFRPIAPASALHAALQANLKIVQNWLDDKDYASAVQTALGVQVLVHLYSYQSNQPAFRDRVAALSAGCTRLVQAAQAKDGAGCQKAMRECEALLAELAREPPAGEKALAKNFKSMSPTKAWMLLVDGTYADAKSAKSARQLHDYAYTIAECSHAMAYLRADPRWREESRAVRDAALAAARKAEAGELEPARLALKAVYQSCEACHQRYKNK